ncbi:MAG: sporulation integral membrane protein YlbJ [Peptococcaceae bacterium]|nr:sporulation integral membrane protein YlbJ [Peptococcaceae bacterium]
MFVAPQEVVAGATAGITLWAVCLLPALLPFFIISDLLVEYGASDFLGALCEPLMRPVFRLPGCAAFVLAIVHTAGMPIGAVLTSQLRHSGQLSRIQGERLLAFSCNPSPGFMFGAVAGGMLGIPALGIVFAGSVYAANLIVGFLFRFYGGKDSGSLGGSGENVSSVLKGNPVSQGIQKLHALQNRGRPLGLALGESAKKNMATLLQIGGYIMIFSVFIRLLKHWPILTFLSKIPSLILGQTHVQEIEAVLTGIIEQTLGCRGAVDAMPTLALQVGAIAFFMGFGGLCVFAQVAGVTAKTDLRLSPFLIARIMQGVLALALSQLGLRYLNLSSLTPVWNTSQLPLLHNPSFLGDQNLPVLAAQSWNMLQWNIVFFGALILLILILAFRNRQAAKQAGNRY